MSSAANTDDSSNLTHAIDESVRRDTIVWLDAEPGLHEAAARECEDSADTGGDGPEGHRAHTEYWGEDGDGYQWRVHIHAPPSELAKQAQELIDAADEGGTIQAEAMLAITSRPDLHTACNMWRVSGELGCRAEVAEILGFDPRGD